MKKILSNIIILFLLTGCLNTKITYTTSIPEECTIYTTKGILVGDYIEVYLDSYIPRYNASHAEVDNGLKDCTITDSFGRYVMFTSPVNLINFFETRGYKYEGTGEYIVNGKMFSSSNFRKL